jgi:ABC-type transport system substrate-binding protein
VAVVLLGLGATACTPPGLPDPIAPTGLASVPSSPPAAGTVVIGLDGSAGRIAGFNPYAIADFSLASQAAASLVLPSAFVVAADGEVTADPDVIDAATVTSPDPFTVTYTVDRKASWSDGTPITAEDFSYLRDQLATQPGTVDPAGYLLISAIRSRDAGKTVEVEFSKPFPDWRTLFSPLLPSHLMKDFPGGWGAALTADLPLSANRYKMTSYDPVTGQISLARNDKYWGTPPGPAAAVLRLGDPADLLAAFSRGDVQALWFAPSGTMAPEIEQAIPADRRTVVPSPASVQLVFNTAAGATSVRQVRAAIAAALTPSVLAADLTAGWPGGGAAVSSQVSLPSETPEQSADGPVPGTGDLTVAAADLTAAGYVNNGLYASKAGEILRLTLGYPSGDPRLAAAARTVQRQLGAIGIEVDLLPDASPNLVETRIAAGTVDLALLSLPRGISDAASASSAFGCPISDVLGIGSTATTTATPTKPAPSTPSTGTGSSRTTGDDDTTESPPTTTTDSAGSAPPVLRTGNLSGYCEPSTQGLLVAAITGAGPVAAADPGLWAALPVLPLIQPSSIFAVSDALRPVLDTPHDGWAWTGPLSGLSGWPVP